jgi:hypothetical protein
MINNTLKRSYVVLFVGLIMSFYGALNSNGLIRDISINLFVTIIGIFVTVFLIDRVIGEDAERKRRRILRTAFKRIPIEKQFSLFMTIGRATAPKGVITSYSDLYDEKYYDYLKNLDFSAEGPGRWNNGRDMNWGEYTTLICTEFRNAINTTMGNYMLYLEPDEIELFQSILSSNFMNFSVTGIDLLLTSNMKLANYHLFDVNGYNGTKKYLDLLKQLVGTFNIYCSPEDIIRL